MSEDQRVTDFKNCCRERFAEYGLLHGFKEVLAPKREYENPYFVKFKSSKSYIGFEGVHWGFGLITRFGNVIGNLNYGIRIAMHSLEGDDLISRHDELQVAGYPRVLEFDIAFIKRHPSFFFEQGYINHTENLRDSLSILTKKYA